MSLLTRRQSTQMFKNGHQHDANHVPCALLDLVIENGGEMSLLLTEINPDNLNEVYGLIDSSDGRPVMGYIDLVKLEGTARAMGRAMTADPDFKAVYPIDVYRAAAETVCYLTTNSAHLKTAARQLGMEPL